MWIDPQERKEKLQILILGPYRPQPALLRLEELRTCLIKRGFKGAKLVKDFPDSQKFDDDKDINFTKKSRFYLEIWAHVPIFVFVKDADNLGVGNELGYTCMTLPNKTSCSVVFVETSLNLGSQIRGTIKLAMKNQKLSNESFQNDNVDDLCNLAFGHCIKLLDRLFYFI